MTTREVSMALQTCRRCQKKRIRCDLLLPACRNCQLSDIECFFYDESLKTEFPRSYLQSLNEQVQELNLEIKTIKANRKLVSNSSPKASQESEIWDQEYHLILPTLHPSAFQFASVYLGRGSSARLMERLLLQGLAELHLYGQEFRNNEVNSLLLSQRPVPGTSQVSPYFATIVDHRKVDLYSAMPPSIQRALIEQYTKVIQQDYPLLSGEQESRLLRYENPLRWSIANSHHPDSHSLTAVFAVATVLASRDVEPSLAAVSFVFRDSLRKLSEQLSLAPNSLTTTKHLVTTLCFLTLCELINPVSGDAWELSGRALVTMEHLRFEYQSSSIAFDEEFNRLEYSLMILGCSITYHFRRPSRIPEIWSSSKGHDFLMSSRGEDLLTIYEVLRQITHGFTITPVPRHSYFENLIPRHLQITSTDNDIGTQSAMIYISLHPLFTASPAGIFSGRSLDQGPSALLEIVASSASTILDTYFQQNRDHKITSIWLSAERVLEAGAVWGVYVIILNRSQTTSDGLFSISTSRVMGPIQKCSTLLASFAERWTDGSIYLEVWETFLSLLWDVLDLPRRS